MIKSNVETIATVEESIATTKAVGSEIVTLALLVQPAESVTVTV